MHVNLRYYKIRKIPRLVGFHSLYQLLHSLFYHAVLKLWISNVKICINEGKSNRKIPKMLSL